MAETADVLGDVAEEFRELDVEAGLEDVQGHQVANILVGRPELSGSGLNLERCMSNVIELQMIVDP